MSYEKIDKEHHQLAWEFQRLNPRSVRARNILNRIEALKKQRWELFVSLHPEFTGYSSFAEGVLHFADSEQILLPDLSSALHQTDHLGRRRFSIYDGLRQVIIQPHEHEKRYSIYLYDFSNSTYETGLSYGGETVSFEQAVRIFSRWYVEACDIGTIVAEFAWLDPRPVELVFQFP